MAFQKAVKSKSFLRLSVEGPSGSGKTMSALRIAAAIAESVGSRVAVIDTEHGSASLYADRFDFDVNELNDPNIERATNAINDAASDGYKVLVLDSLTHPWEELLQEIDDLAKRKFKNNRWGAWSEGTPKQKKFIKALLSYPGHIIGTMRVSTEWEIDPETKKPIRIGLKPQQGKGMEYEFTLCMSINHEHLATIVKDRTGKYQDVEIFKPGEDFGRELYDWLSVGTDTISPDDLETLLEVYRERITTAEDIAQIGEAFNAMMSDRNLTPDNRDELKALCTEQKKAIRAAQSPQSEETPPPSQPLAEGKNVAQEPPVEAPAATKPLSAEQSYQKAVAGDYSPMTKGSFFFIKSEFDECRNAGDVGSVFGKYMESIKALPDGLPKWLYDYGEELRKKYNESEAA